MTIRNFNDKLGFIRLSILKNISGKRGKFNFFLSEKLSDNIFDELELKILSIRSDLITYDKQPLNPRKRGR